MQPCSWCTAATLAQEAGDPQVVLPVLAEAAFVRVELGDLDAARGHAQASLQAAARYVSGVVPADPSLALIASELGIEDALRARISSAPPEDRWAPPIRAMLGGDQTAAAEHYAEMGVRTLEAQARLRAAEELHAQGREREAEGQLEPALAFWRSVGASRYVSRGEALLRVSA